jgi:hypothetical protein
MNDELKSAIRQGTTLKKVDPGELKSRDDERKKRAEELKKIVEKLSNAGGDPVNG